MTQPRRRSIARHLAVVAVLLMLLLLDAGVSGAPTPQTPILRTTTTTTATTWRPTATSAMPPNATADGTTTPAPATTETTSVSDAIVATATDELTADIVDLFVANQDFSVIEQLQAEADGTQETSTERQQQQPTVAASTPTAYATSDESGDDDALFDVIIDGTAASNASAEMSTAAGVHDRMLEVDSEEFFVPADIKERETTAAPTADRVSSTTPSSSSTTGAATIMTTTSSQFVPNPDTDTDADTIFYISNTEVKVRESAADNMNNNNINADVATSAHPASADRPPPPQQPDEELQFFPASYEEGVIIDVRRQNSTAWRIGTGRPGPDRYVEDLIISQPKHQKPESPPSGNRKVSDTSADGRDENLSISYVGESYIEVKEFSRDLFATAAAPDREATAAVAGLNYAEYVIIEPIAETPGVKSTTTGGPPAIGVPIIEELPPALIGRYTLPSADNRDADNEILPPVRTTVDRTNGRAGQSFEDGSRAESIDAAGELPSPGGAAAMLHDWLNGVFGKNVPSKRNNHVGGTAGAGGPGSSTAPAATGATTTTASVLNRTVTAAAAADVNGTVDGATVAVLNGTTVAGGISQSRMEKSKEEELGKSVSGETEYDSTKPISVTLHKIRFYHSIPTQITAIYTTF